MFRYENVEICYIEAHQLFNVFHCYKIHRITLLQT